MFEQRSKEPIASSFSRYCGKVGIVDAEVDCRGFDLYDCHSKRTTDSKDHIHADCYNSLHSFGKQKREITASIQHLHPLHEEIRPDFVSASSTSHGPPLFIANAVQSGSAAGKCGNVIVTPYRPNDPVAKFLDSQC